MTDEFTIVHLSDMHFREGGAWHFDATDTVAALEPVLDHLEPVRRVDLVACSGDLSDDGSVDSYRRLRDMVEPWALNAVRRWSSGSAIMIRPPGCAKRWPTPEWLRVMRQCIHRPGSRACA